MKKSNTFLWVLSTILTFSLLITPMSAFEEGKADETADNEQPVDGSTTPDTDPVEGNIEVHGWIGEYNGETDPNVPQPPEGSNSWVDVTIPKTVLFGSLATDNGRVYGPNYTITNKSTKSVEVSTVSFTETTQPIAGVSNTLGLDIVSNGITLPVLKEGPEYLGTDFTGSSLAVIPTNADTNFTVKGTFSGKYPAAGAPVIPKYKLVLQFKAI